MEELDDIQELINLYLQPESNIIADEHRSIDTAMINYLKNLQTQVNNIATSLYRTQPRVVGYFTGFDPAGGNIGQSYQVYGDITSAVLQSKESDNSVVRITMAFGIGSLKYYVDMLPESLGSLNLDNDIGGSVFRVINSNTFDYTIHETSNVAQNLKIHLKVTEYL